jgi:outer membrane protein assembly factor BamB
MTTPVESVIDLDRVPEAGGARTPRGLSVAWGRRLKAVVVVVVALLTGGAVAPEPGPRLLAALSGPPVVAVALGDAVAFVAVDDLPGGSAIRRYGLDDDVSAVQWSANLTEEVIALRWVAAPDVVVAELDLNRSGYGTMVLDGPTGQILWRADATDIVALPGTSALLIERRIDGHAVGLRSVDMRSGVERWRRDVRPDDILLLDPDPATGDVTRTVTVVGTDGTATVVGTNDGATVARRSLGVRLAPSDRDFQRDFVEIAVVGDLFLVARRNQGTATIDAFRLGDLTPAWRTSGDPVGKISDCGGLLCVSDDRTVSTIDPVSATVRWADDRWLFLVPFGTQRLLSYGTGDDLSVVDAATGDLVTRLGTGVLLPGSPPTVLLQDTGRQRTVVMEADRSGTRVRTLGSVPSVDAYGCLRRAKHLACRYTDGTARLWRLP